MRKTKRTEAELAEWRERMKGLADRVRAMSETERQAKAQEIGTVTCEGRPLSHFNCCYLWTQAGRPLLQVGGFVQWQKAGRVVRKGEKAAGYIFVPKRKAADPNKRADEFSDSDFKSPGFVQVPVFDVTQTEPVGLEGVA